jgi:hypothetical protein
MRGMILFITGLEIIFLASAVQPFGTNWLGQVCPHPGPCFRPGWLAMGIGLSAAAYIAWKVTAAVVKVWRPTTAGNMRGPTPTWQRGLAFGAASATARRFPILITPFSPDPPLLNAGCHDELVYIYTFAYGFFI